MDLSAVINPAVLSALANADIAWTGGSARCVFDAAYADPLGIASTRTTVRVEADAALVAGLAVTVTPDGGVATAYTVREAEPDGRGMVLLALG